ncbi:MAG: 30S ribosomal protein S11 [Spiroplasma sp.]|nr:30S ribosomal protein S11 [Mycoplasmatales bacterium]
MAVKKTKRKTKKHFESGVAHIHATWNNTIINITDEAGNSLAWASAGVAGFKGSKKSTPFAAQQATMKVVESVQAMGMKKVKVETKGSGPGRDTSIKTLKGAGIDVTAIQNKTPNAHNGCRPPKGRR